MLIGTHALLPVCAGLLIENAALAKGRGHFFPPWSLPLIGFFGALPDLCTPHISLEARYSSWSHTQSSARANLFSRPPDILSTPSKRKRPPRRAAVHKKRF